MAQYNGSTLLGSTANSYTTNSSPYELHSSTVKDGSGNTVAYTGYGYDEGTLLLTSGLPQHTSAPGARGNLTSTHVSIDGTTSNTLNTSTAYYDTGQPQSTTTPSGSTTYVYDSTQAFVMSSSLPPVPSGASLTTSATYDPVSGAVLTATGLNTGQTAAVTQYDNYLRPAIVTPISGPQITIAQSSPFGATPARSTTTQGSSTSTTQYDGYGRTSRVATYNGQSNLATSYYQQDSCYDASGLLSFQPVPYAGPGLGSQANSPKQCSGVGTQYTYDALGRPSQVTNADGTATTTYTGRAVKTTDVTGTVSKITQYDLLGRISGVCEISANSSMPSSGYPVNCGMDIAGTGFLTTYAYNLANHTTTITQGAQTRVFQTDAAGRTIYVSEPERGVTKYSYVYNATGLAVTRTRPMANQTAATTSTTTTTQYDSLGRTVSVIYSDGTPAKQFQYDQAALGYSNSGELTTASTAQGGTVASFTQMNYDILSNVAATSQCLPGLCSGSSPFTVARSYTYDPTLGARTQESYYTGGTSGTRVDTNMTYTAAGELQSMSNTGYGTILSNMTNSVFGPTSYAFGNGLNGVRTYDGLGRAASQYVCANSTSASCSGGSQAYGMTQTVVGSRVTAMYDSVLGTNATPGYDEFNRLSSMNYTNRGQAFSYTYDRYGNRWSQTATQGSGPSPQLSFNVANNQLSGNSYDAAGNLLSDGFHSYTYDAEGNVIAVDGGATVYVYDAFNHRVRTTTSSADTYYSFNTDGQRVASWSAGTTPLLLAAYAYWNGTPITTYNNAGTFYSHQDLLGTKRLTTDANGNVAGSYQSLPFGDSFTTTGADPDASHFALLDHDSESGTEHAQFRQYSSTFGNWFSPDPYDGSYDVGSPQSLNRYTYASNNPLIYTDASGQTPCSNYAPTDPNFFRCLAALPCQNYNAACGYTPNDAYSVSNAFNANYYANYYVTLDSRYQVYNYSSGVVVSNGTYTIYTGQINVTNPIGGFAGLGSEFLPQQIDNSQLTGGLPQTFSFAAATGAPNNLGNQKPPSNAGRTCVAQAYAAAAAQPAVTPDQQDIIDGAVGALIGALSDGTAALFTRVLKGFGLGLVSQSATHLVQQGGAFNATLNYCQAQQTGVNIPLTPPIP